MATIHSPFSQKLKIEFFSKDQELEGLQSCVQHCNLQIKKAQRSWAKIVYDNKIIVITLMVSSVITCIALNSLFSIVALPLVVVPILYATYKFSSLQNEAKDRFAKTQKVFCNVLDKYKEKVSSTEDHTIDIFMQSFTNSPRTLSSLKTKEEVDEIVKNCGDAKGLGSLVKIVFNQVVKDQIHLDKISDYQTTFYVGSTAILLIAQNIDQFFGPYSLLVPKPLLITSALFTAGVVGGFATYNYMKHWNDPKIGEDVFKANLHHLNDVLDISQEHRAPV
ncbi:MAG: hypothetical protein C5B45_03655 [Chlamydiae bacterium]|nr:MAG: hypothetical protein C5B45_03655 [Chlamydiota bacterium]